MIDSWLLFPAEANEKERRFFLAELEVMKAITPHPNVLPLIGCYTASGKAFISSDLCLSFI